MKTRIIILYFLMLAGGLWNALGVLQDAMQLLASPLIIALGIWTYIEAMLVYKGGEGTSTRAFTLWAIAVMVLSIAVEGLGVHTGMVFGEYTYGDTLQPQVFGVPVAIGFAWFTMMVSSAALVFGFERGGRLASIPVLSMAMAFVMTGFDSLMEPAATALNYWRWTGGFIPIQNYITWFMLSFIFAVVGLRTRALPRKEFRFGMHVFLAQATYFVLTSAGAYIRTI